MMVTDILIEPVSGEFDIAEIEAYLTAQPHTARDEHAPEHFMIASSDEGLEEAREARRGDPRRFPTNVILVEVGATCTGIYYRIPPVAPARRFAEWLRTRYEVRFMDDGFRDLTSECRENLDYLFGAPE